MKPDCKPIAVKSRRYSQDDCRYIESEVQRLLKEDIIEPSTFTWRAQVLVTVNDRHKKHMVIDYSQTINQHTQLDAYPLPHNDDQINELAKNSVFSTIDLKDATTKFLYALMNDCILHLKQLDSSISQNTYLLESLMESPVFGETSIIL